MLKNRSVPTDVILPHITYQNVAAALGWLTNTFGFTEHYRYGGGRQVEGAQMHLSDAWIMLNRARPGRASAAQAGLQTQSLTVFVEDVDSHYGRAKAAGARIVEDLHDTEYGERQYGAEDLEGHHWLFSRHARDVSPEEWGATVAGPLAMTNQIETVPAAASNAALYRALMEVVRNRMTNRAFAPCEIPREHFEMILEAARHAPSGANAQPWHYIVVTDPSAKASIAQCFLDEQQHRVRLRMGFPTPNYAGVKTAPGLIVVAVDFRFVRAFPVLDDGSDEDRLYRQNAERILLQSVAASTMSAHLAAAALGYAVWWITAIGQEDIQKKIKPLLGVPEELAIIDVMCFGPPLKASYKRWKRRLDQIVNWDRFNPENFMTAEQIAEWIKTRRHKVMYRDETNVD